VLPTVGDLLGLDVIRRGSPQVVAGSGGLGARVRWVHVLELADAAHLLQGGELVLTTGVALPAEPALLARYASDLAVAGVSALAVELGRRYVGSLPSALVRAATDSGLTLIAFEREVPFVEITEAVHARIIDAQLEELRVSERLHEVFTELSVAGASTDEIVRQAAILAGRPVILADLSHRRLPRGRRQQGRGGQELAPSQADLLRAAAADRANPRHRPEFGRIPYVAARGDAGIGSSPGDFGPEELTVPDPARHLHQSGLPQACRQASRTWPARSTTGPSQLQGKLIHRSVRFQT
jgi:Purine catabolism regulatory protein-like family